MELSTKQVSRKEPIYRADIAKLSKALADPASVHSSKNHNGYVCLSGENASWDMCARVAYNALKGRNHAKATSFVFQLGREVIEAHGWQDRLMVVTSSVSSPLTVVEETMDHNPSARNGFRYF